LPRCRRDGDPGSAAGGRPGAARTRGDIHTAAASAGSKRSAEEESVYVQAAARVVAFTGPAKLELPLEL